MQVVGYYQANELCDDMELGPFGKTIAEKIRAQCKHATVLLVRGPAPLPKFCSETLAFPASCCALISLAMCAGITVPLLGARHWPKAGALISEIWPLDDLNISVPNSFT